MYKGVDIVRLFSEISKKVSQNTPPLLPFPGDFWHLVSQCYVVGNADDPVMTAVKDWIVCQGVLMYRGEGGNVAPSAEEIYAAIFEENYSGNISKADREYLTSHYNFSRYPIDLYLIITSENKKIKCLAEARGRSGSALLNKLDSTVDHICIEGKWYPYPPGVKDELERILSAGGVHSLGEISLGQYLFLLKESLVNSLVVNFVKEDVDFASESSNGETALKDLKASLYEYQKSGWRWLSTVFRERLGGILADEMGLGKTLQIIALLHTERSFPALIVCPSTLLENWRREFVKFSPQIRIYVHHGYSRTGFPKELMKHEVTVTSYETVVRDGALLESVKWSLIVCDEAQAIKNPSAKRTLALKRLKALSSFAVTGTPVENNLTDLWSIMDFAVPGLLGTKETFERAFTQNLDGAKQLEQVVTPLILRRKVNDVARDLPPKIVIPQALELTNEEKNDYESIRLETVRQFQTGARLAVLSRLRMYCAHPLLLQENSYGNPTEGSTKYRRFVEIVEEIAASGSKVIVFTSFNRMNELIRNDIRTRFGIYTESIFGETDVGNRQKIVDEFSAVHGAALLVLNPVAAGTGLNITAANHVIHYNLEWNPAKEDQASARAYRRGQDRAVTIHRLFYINTVEEVIDDRLQRKRQLADLAIVGVSGTEDDYDDILKAINRSPTTNRDAAN